MERSGAARYCPQEPQLYERLTCDGRFELFASIYGLARDGASREAADVCETAVKLNLALTLLADPGLLLLYEPYAGCDWDTYLKFLVLVA